MWRPKSHETQQDKPGGNIPHGDQWVDGQDGSGRELLALTNTVLSATGSCSYAACLGKTEREERGTELGGARAKSTSDFVNTALTNGISPGDWGWDLD